LKDFVSSRSILAVGSVASMSILWVIFVLPVAGILSGGLLGLLTLGAALLIGIRSTRSLAQVIRDVAEEPVPVPVTVTPVRGALPVSKTIH
jgi:hypothetical protein